MTSPRIDRVTEPPPRNASATPSGRATEILDVATAEFADRGYAGARVDEIAARTRTTKRMIYYYFGGKEQLYIAVLERAYARDPRAPSRRSTSTSSTRRGDPAARRTDFDHHESHPDFIRLVSIENIHRAEHMAELVSARRPQHAGDRRARRDPRARPRRGRVPARASTPIDVHMMISAFCVFRVANRHTFGTHLRPRPDRPRARDHYRTMLGDMVVEYVS